MTDNTRVLFNDQCPVCSFVIRHYERYSKEAGLPLRFDDLNTCNVAKWGITEDMAARRLHVLHNKTLFTGMSAFLILWNQMPRYRWLARVAGLPGIFQFLSFAYDWGLAPVVYRWHLWRRKKQAM